MVVFERPGYANQCFRDLFVGDSSPAMIYECPEFNTIVPSPSSPPSEEHGDSNDDDTTATPPPPPVPPTNITVNCSCSLPPIVHIDRIQFCNPALGGAWLLAIGVGLIGGWSLLRMGSTAVGARSSAVSFLLFAIMMTSGFVVHSVFLVECGEPLPAERVGMYIAVALFDGILSSVIAMSFFFNGLVDLKVLDESKCHTWVSMILAYAGIAAAYIQGVNFEIVYVLLIAVGCGGYLLMQLLRMYIQDDARGIGWFLLAGTAGALTFAPVAIPQLSCILCEIFGGWIVEGQWYYGADIVMFLVCKYILATRRLQGYSYIPSSASSVQLSVSTRDY